VSGVALPRRSGRARLPRRERAERGRAAPGVPDRATLPALATFIALAAFCTAHWVALVSGPPTGRTIATVAVAAVTVCLLSVLARLPVPRPAVHLAALLVVLGALALALAAMGLPARLLAPGNWDELGPELYRGLSGIRTVEWPYAGDDEQVRLVILLGAPLLLILAAGLAVWPARRFGGVLRGLGLVCLLLLYAIPVTENDPGEPLVRGFVLFMLVGAWLWLPSLRGRAAALGAAVVMGVGLMVLPVASRLDAEAALVDYRSWNWFGGEGIVFNWNHTYGPLDWPREGTILLDVEADRPLYWKAETLDTFDGLRWQRSGANDNTSADGELPPGPEQRWFEEIDVTVRSLRTDFVVGSGTPLQIDGVGDDSVAGSADGTIRRLDEPLERGDSYEVGAYVPNPSVERMRQAGALYPAGLGQYTRVELPVPGETALPDGSSAVTESVDRPAVDVPLWDGPGGPAFTGGALPDSPYARTYALARRLTGGAPSAYDAVAAVEDHVRGQHTYSERPPSQEYPLEAFLFEDRIGYCQQFSGAMALMLRMAGIPARVVSGFSPGARGGEERREYEVRDLDAHSWVEVYFPDIGWVTFDPTPRAAPADRSGLGPEAEPLDIPTGGETSSAGGDSPLSDRAAGDARVVGPDGPIGEEEGSGLVPALVVAGLIAIGAAVLVRRTRRGSRQAPGGAEAGLVELERALPRLGWQLGRGTTLLELEARLARAAGPAAAGYVARLRALRYSPDPSPRGASGPGAASAATPAERRAVRRELSAPGGLRARARGFLVLPPGGPRPRPRRARGH